MKVRFCLFLSTCIILAFSWNLGAKIADTDYIFSNLSVSDGLSQNTVLSIVQDDAGSIWLATFDGLNKYDAYDFSVYRHVEGDSTSIAANTVRTLLLDSEGRLWAGTDAGLSLYDRRKDRFRNRPTPEGRVTGIAEIGSDRLMVSTEGRLRIFDISKELFVEGEIPEYMAVMPVETLYAHEGHVYIGTRSSGLFVYSIAKKEFRRLAAFDSYSQINVIMASSPALLWIGTEGDGLYRIDLTESSVTNWRYSSQNSSIASNYVRSIGMDAEGKVWIGTFGGLNIMDGDDIILLHSNPFAYGSLSQNSIRSIFRDKQQGMWLGTYYGGVNYWNPLKNRFRHIQMTQNLNSLNDNIISCIVEDDDGVLWIGTNNGGVNRYDPLREEFRNYSLKVYGRAAAMESNDIKAIFIGEGSPYIYIGAHAGGLNVLDSRNGEMRHLGPVDGRDGPDDVYSIIRADGNHLYLGSLDGLWIFDLRKRRFFRPEGADLLPRRIKILHEDDRGLLWVGGEDGLRVCRIGEDFKIVNIEKELAGEYDKVPDLLQVQCFHESSMGTMWIGTRNGLYRYEPSRAAMERYTSERGLPNDIIRSIGEDSHGRLWISTDKGLSCFNPYSDSFRNYTSHDGLQSDLFNTGSYCRTADGEMYFGGINGITSFIPEKLEDNPYSPDPVLTGLRVRNRLITPDDGSGILSESISMVSSITLKHYHNYFSIDFSVPDYLSGGHGSFAYCLEGFDKDWNLLTGQRSVSYSNLKKGKYRFLLRAANCDGKWNGEPTVLEIKVKPVWYKSIAAYIFFILLAVASVLGVMKFVIERKNMESRLKLEKQESEHNEELNQMKMRFFINISHELRTPLTLIINPLREMTDKASDLWMRKQLKYVERNARRMLHLVNQLMDYRRAELGVFRLRLKEEEVGRIARENWAYYENLAKSKKLKYTFVSEIGDRKMFVDVQYLDLILNNLLSNAFKYTEEGSISVELAEEDNCLILRVRDTGIGIADTEKDKIFERFYQLESKHIGSGIGLSLVQRLVELHHGEIRIESVLGEGSCFIVSLPQDLALYSKEEVGSDEVYTHITNTKELYTLDAETKAEDRVEDSGYAKRGRILIAEDNEEIRTYMSDGLSKYFEIILAKDGAEALELLKADSEVDIVITDLMMPVMDGMKLCAAIKQNSDTSHIPVIMLSAKTDSTDAEEAVKAGVDDYMYKPFSMAVLAGKVRNMMRTQKMQRDRVTRSLDVLPEKLTFNAVDEDFLKRAVAIIEKNMDNVEFSTDVFARAMNMSRSNLHIRMKAITGQSALEFIHRVRFREACRMLEQGGFTVSEISDRTGFSTPSYFATCFKKYMGCNPSDYMKKTNN